MDVLTSDSLLVQETAYTSDYMDDYIVCDGDDVDADFYNDLD